MLLDHTGIFEIALNRASICLDCDARHPDSPNAASEAVFDFHRQAQMPKRTLADPSCNGGVLRPRVAITGKTTAVTFFTSPGKLKFISEAPG